MQIRHGRIDTHHHLFPPAFQAEMKRRGIIEEAGTKIPAWTPKKSLAVMDANGIQTAVLSLSAPGVYFGRKREAVTLARQCNEYSASLAARHPGRFGSFAVLPMPFTDQACAEAVHALEVLGADGIVLLGSTDGHFLGDPRFEELMVELNRRRAVVFVHPNLHRSSTELPLVAPGFILEFLCDTTRAALNLILRGVTHRHPDIRWILAHAGGFLPYVAWRASLANGLPGLRAQMPHGLLHYVRQFYFDTALSPAPMSMAALRELVDPSHILFGSDFPYAPAVLTATQVRTLEASTLWSPEVRHGIDRAHALALFPRFAQPGEDPSAGPQYLDETVPDKVRRVAVGVRAGLIERLRDQ